MVLLVKRRQRSGNMTVLKPGREDTTYLSLDEHYSGIKHAFARSRGDAPFGLWLCCYQLLWSCGLISTASFSSKEKAVDLGEICCRAEPVGAKPFISICPSNFSSRSSGVIRHRACWWGEFLLLLLWLRSSKGACSLWNTWISSYSFLSMFIK